MKRLIALNLILIGCLLASGCSVVHNSLRPSGKSSQWNLFNRGTAKKSASPKKEMPPENMVVIWKDAVLEKAGTTSVRGFGARIFFHDAENQAVKVEGDLVVFGFDDSGSDGTLLSKRPTKKFVFTNEQFQTHYSESNLGASYSIWIPWDKVGEGHKTIALIPVFKTTAGLTLNGGSTTNVLPADKTVEEEDKNLISINKKRKQSNKNQVTQAGFSAEDQDGQSATQAIMNEDVPPKPGIKSTTIQLTPSMSRFLSQPTAIKEPSADQPSKPLTKDASQKDLPLTKLATVPGMGKTNAAVAENDSNQPIIDTASPIERKGNASHTIKKSPVFGAPGSFR